jgi:WhiB family redox-sensing transcriptional regulator
MRSYQARRTAEQRRQQTIPTPDRDPYRRVYLDEGDTTFMASGACRDTPVGVFFRGRDVALARTICARCEVVDACRQYATSTRQEYGVWGGMTVDELAATRRRRVAS